MAYVSQDDKAKLAPAIKKVLNKYGMKGSISIRHHSTLVVTLQSGAIQFEHSHGDGYTQVNVYHIESHYEGHAKSFLLELLAAMKGPNYFNNDDAMTDYFHRSHYTDINIGKWNKPYFLQDLHKPKKAKVAKTASKKPIKASKTTSFNGWTPEVIQGSKSIKLPTNSTITDGDTAEDLARMNNKELDKVVDRLVDSYPTLAELLMSRIGFAMLDKEGL
jgi:hypothetical protein|tara:strand:+ start:234 stop:887 length:654 start_codon:yes stop_codon:yes gene_type:complete